MMHSIYFLSYAVILTVSAMVVASALYSRSKNEGTPINYKLFMGVSGVALAMWTGAALTEYAYEPNTTNAGFVVFCLAIWLIAGFAWQVNVFMKKHQSRENGLDELCA